MLAAMGIMLPSSIQHANALKVLFALLINAVAAVIFVAKGAVLVPQAALMAAASIAGGFVGAQLAKRLQASIYFQNVAPSREERVADRETGINYYHFTITGKVAY